MSLRLSLFLCLLSVSLVSGLKAQNPYTAEYWEDNWRDWPRPRFDYRIDSFVAVENVIQREYFQSNSNISGEIYRHYARFQYPDKKAIEEHRELLFQLPNYEVLEDIDFRIWDRGLLHYEARAAAIREYYLDSISADPFTDKLFAFRLRFPDLKPGQIVEVMITCKGVPLPYHLSFEQSFPVIKSYQRIKMLSAFPLRYRADSIIKVERDRKFDFELYSFQMDKVTAYPLETGLSTQLADLPAVWLDWKDQIFYYDRDERDDWAEVLPYLFYQGDLQDFIVYRNSLAEEFGLQQFYGSWIRPVRFFHGRSEEYQVNSAYAEGGLRLSKAYANIWLEVEEELNRVVIDNQVPVFDEALSLVLKAQEKAVRTYLKNLPIEPPVFREYGLLCSHLEKLLNYFQYDYRLALFSPARFGVPPKNFASPWSAVARGLAFRKDSLAQWTYLIPGPYMSQFYGPNRLPPDLSEGWVQLFFRGDSVPEVLGLPKVKVTEHGFQHVFHQQQRNDKGHWVLNDTLYFEGAFRSILAAGYLRSDSVKDQLSYTNHQLVYQFEKNDSMLVGRSQTQRIADSLIFLVPLDEALSILSLPAPKRSFALPMPFRAEWLYRFKVEDSLAIQLIMPELEPNPYYELSALRRNLKNGEVEVRIQLSIEKTLIKSSDLAQYNQLRSILKEGVPLTIWRLKN